MQTPLLLHFRVSHYNEKVRWALDFKRWPHRRRALVPGFHIPRVRARTGQNKLPVLIMNGKALFGSGHILNEIERLQPEPRLFPEAAADLARAMAIQAYFDDEVAPAVRRLFWSCYLGQWGTCARMSTDGAAWPIRVAWWLAFPLMRPLFRVNMGMKRQQLEQAHAALEGYFDRLESEIGPSGYLVGDQFGLADLAAAAVMTAIIRPPQFSYPLPEPWPKELVDLRASVSHKPAFRWVLDIYAQHRGVSAEIRG